MFGQSDRCQHCDDFPSSGKCAKCYGTGNSIHLNSDSPLCEECKGSGICQYCKGQPTLGPPFSRRLKDEVMAILGRLFG